MEREKIFNETRKKLIVFAMAYKVTKDFIYISIRNRSVTLIISDDKKQIQTSLENNKHTSVMAYILDVKIYTFSTSENWTDSIGA